MFIFYKNDSYIIGKNIESYGDLFWEMLDRDTESLLLYNISWADELKYLLRNLKNLSNKQKIKLRDKIEQGTKIPVYTIDQEKCTQCKLCISRFSCPAFYYGEDDRIFIDEQQCNGCGNCANVCGFKAIHQREDKK